MWGTERLSSLPNLINSNLSKFVMKPPAKCKVVSGTFFLTLTQVAESLVVNHGEFLIRDSQSNHGDFVLTCHWQQKTLHFLIRRTVLQSSETYTRVQYSLEEEAFDSLPALVHFYVGSKAALTQWSGAQIHRPVNRTLPLSYLDTAFGTIIGTPSSHGDILCGQPRMCHRRSDQTHLHMWSIN